MNIEDLIRKYEDEKANASYQVILAKAEFHKYEDKPEYREAWIVSFNDLNKWVKAESIYARVLYDLRNLEDVNNLNYSEKPKSPDHIADISKKVCKQYTIDELYELHEKYEKKGDCLGYCGECGINMFFKWVRGLEEKE